MRRREAMLLLAGAALGGAARARPAARVAVFDVEGDPAARGELSRAVRAWRDAAALDAGWVDAAARGAGYAGSLNMTLEEARRLSAVVGADALVLGRSSVLERESDNGSRFWDGFLGLFLVDGRSGGLARYAGLRAEATTREAAAARLSSLAGERLAGWDGAVGPRDAAAVPPPEVELDLVASGDVPEGAVEPRFFKRPSPGFTEDADRAHVVATVDVVAYFNADATYGPIEVVRWAGFGLDEASIAAVRGANFWPARLRDRAVSARALLRFNFRFRDS